MEKQLSDRTGIIIKQLTGYYAFIPHQLCPDGPDIKMDSECIKLMSEADRALGELKGTTGTLANPDLFIAFYVKKEALLSSQIEGTQCSLDEVLQVDDKTSELKPVYEVVNYINAMKEGLARLQTFPMSLRLINDIHKVLLKGVRGKHKTPGEYKKIQNWIGGSLGDINKAAYVPPPPEKMLELMGDLEKYYHADKLIPPLLEAAVIHSQFETIHPYADGNGRLGRLLITFMLCEKKILDKPLLYLSLFFKENREEYYQLLMNVRLKGQWEEWIKFFLTGVRDVSKEAINTANDIRALQTKHADLVKDKFAKYSISVPLYDLICQQPILSISYAVKHMKSTYPTMKKAFQNFLDAGILGLPEGANKRGTLYIYADYLKIFKRGT